MLRSILALLACIPALAWGKPGPPDKEPAGTVAQLRQKLVASIQDDLEATRKAPAADPGRANGLAYALECIGRSPGPPENSRAPEDTWKQPVLLNGSAKSTALALALLNKQDAEKQAAADAYVKRSDEEGRRVATALFQAKTAKSIEPLLATISQATTAQDRRPAAAGPEQRILGQWSLLEQLATQWKTQLAYREAGQNPAALGVLKVLSQQQGDRWMPWVDETTLLRKISLAAKAAGKPTAEEIRRKIDQFTTQAFNARTPEEIDPLITEIQSLSLLYDFERTDRESRLSLDALLRLLEISQDAAFAIRNNQSEALKLALDRLADPQGNFRSIPLSRSKLIARVASLRNQAQGDGTKSGTAADSPEAILARMISLEAIAPNLEAFQKAASEIPDFSARAKWIFTGTTLERISNSVQRLKDGLGDKRAVFQSNQELPLPRVADLKRRYDLLCLDTCFGTAAGLHPAETETAESYCRRIKPALVKAQQWELLRTFTAACRTVAPQGSLMSLDDDNALSSLLYGIKLADVMHDPRMAACAFQAVVANPSTLIPAAVVADRMEKIRATDAKAHAEGIELSLNVARSERTQVPGQRNPPLEWILPAGGDK